MSSQQPKVNVMRDIKIHQLATATPSQELACASESYVMKAGLSRELLKGSKGGSHAVMVCLDLCPHC
jgi:hypothetical protein